MNTVSMRLGCVTGRAHAGAELHGFLSYLVKCNLSGRKYRIYGYKGKQVRDNIHGKDVARAIYEWLKRPGAGNVFNIGGGRLNSVSILEAISLTENITGRQMLFEYIDQPRKGDHICYISNTGKFSNEHRGWSPALSLEDILNDLAIGWSERLD